MAGTLAFETTACSRCGGCGSYSYCQQWGSTCFGCKGKGITLSKRGAKAAAAYDAHRLALCGRLASDVQVGDRVFLDGKFRTIEAVGAGGTSRSLRDGVWTEHTYISLVFTKQLQAGPQVNHHGVLPGTLVRYPATPEQWAALVAFADTLTGALLDGQPSAATVKADASSAKRAATKAAKQQAAAEVAL